VYVVGTNGDADAVNASGDAAGGTTASGQPTEISVASNAQANVNGGDNSIYLGTGDSLGAYGGANTINSGAGGLVYVGNTNGAFDTVDANGDQLGGSTANGQPTGVLLENNVQINLDGSNNGVDLGTGDSFSALGGANTINTQAGDLVALGNTNGAFDVVNGSGDQVGGTTANGQGTGIDLNSDTQANLEGGNDGVNLGTGDDLGLLNGSGYSISGSDSTVATQADVGGTLTGSGDSLDLGGTGDNFFLGGGNDGVQVGATGDYLGLLGGSGYGIIASDLLVTTTPDTDYFVQGTANDLNVSTGDALGVDGGDNVVNSQPDTYVNAELTGAAADVFNGSDDTVALDPSVYADVTGNDDRIDGSDDHISVSGTDDPTFGSDDYVDASGTGDFVDGSGDSDSGTALQV